MKEDKCVIVYNSVLKQTRAGKHIPPLELDRFESENLCIVTHLKTYIERTKPLRQGKELFVSYVQPHKGISRDTLRRWIKSVLEEAGIDTNVFSAHSTRSAATSTAQARDVSLKTILDTAGWSNKKTFSRFYQKPVAQKSRTLAQAVLDNFVHESGKTD